MCALQIFCIILIIIDFLMREVIELRYCFIVHAILRNKSIGQLVSTLEKTTCVYINLRTKTHMLITLVRVNGIVLCADI